MLISRAKELNILSLLSFPSVRDEVSREYKIVKKNYIFLYIILYVLNSKQEEKRI